MQDIGGILEDAFALKDLSLSYITSCFFFSIILGLYVFFAYRVVTRRTFYNKSFAISLFLDTIIITAIILTIQSSLVVSLGMVGALSIVRYRTAIKDPMDLAFLFWSISIGIICGAGLAEIAVISSIIVTIGLLILNILPVAKASMILVVNANDAECEDQICEACSQYNRHYSVKNRTIANGRLNLVIEINVKDGADLVKDVSGIEGVTYSALVDHNGEISA